MTYRRRKHWIKIVLILLLLTGGIATGTTLAQVQDWSLHIEHYLITQVHGENTTVLAEFVLNGWITMRMEAEKPFIVVWQFDEQGDENATAAVNNDNTVAWTYQTDGRYIIRATVFHTEADLEKGLLRDTASKQIEVVSKSSARLRAEVIAASMVYLHLLVVLLFGIGFFASLLMGSKRARTFLWMFVMGVLTFVIYAVPDLLVKVLEGFV